MLYNDVNESRSQLKVQCLSLCFLCAPYLSHSLKDLFLGKLAQMCSFTEQMGGRHA